MDRAVLIIHPAAFAQNQTVSLALPALNPGTRFFFLTNKYLLQNFFSPE